jgi:uncharacterized protein YdhG (YjbR/CyaY superfamily)
LKKKTSTTKGLGADTVGAYVAGFPRPTQALLKKVRSAIRKALPGAEEVISYGIPAYRVEGRIVLYFAGWKEHFSLYPATARLAEAFKRELAPYELSGKGTVRFPFQEPIPVRLIGRIAAFRVKEERERVRKK